MADRLPLDLSSGWYESFSRQMADLKCENMRPFFPESDGYNFSGARSTDGIREEVDTLLKTSRGAIEAGGVPYFVQDDTLISLAADGTQTNYTLDDGGSAVTIVGTGRVSMAASSSLIWIVVPNGNTYFFRIGTGRINLNLDAGMLSGANAVVFFRSFFFFCSTTQVWNADLDGVSFTATSFGTAEVNPDPIQSILEVNGQFYAVGTETIQPYRGVGGSGFPIATVTTSTVQRGMAAKFAWAKADNTFFFMGGGDQQEVAIWRFVGNDAVKISTPAVDHYMQGLSNTEIEGVFAWSYQTEGEEYVGFTFANKTLVYQVIGSRLAQKSLLHERSSSETRWRVNTVVRAYNQIYVGDERTEKIGIIDPSIFTEYGDTLHREIVSQPFNFKGAPLFANSYEMVCATGVGIPADPNPVLNHTYSNNGVNFIPSHVSRDLGEAGDFGVRCVFRRKGKLPQKRVFKWWTDTPAETTFYRMEAEVSGAS